MAPPSDGLAITLSACSTGICTEGGCSPLPKRRRGDEATETATLAPTLCSIQRLDTLSDAELAHLEVEEARKAEKLCRQIALLCERMHRHETQRRWASRERLRRSFAASSLARVLGHTLCFLSAADTLRCLAASPAVAAELAQQPPGPRGCGRVGLHHLRHVRTGLSTMEASDVVARLHWPSVRTMAIDLRCPGWVSLLLALGEARAPELCSLHAVSVTFPTERANVWLQTWQVVAPLLRQLGRHLAAVAPLQELVLTGLRSAEMLTAALTACGRHLRVCRASLIGPESRRHPLELPATGLPVLECLMLRHRDFCEQRASRQERLRVFAEPLLACLQAIREPRKLRVLVLAGIRIDGSKQETAGLLCGLKAFSGLLAVALRFSVPSTFGTLLPLSALIGLRRSWPRVGHFALGDMSLHGFDYWPEQMTDFQQLYPHGCAPPPAEVFNNEFQNVLATQYNTDAQLQWSKLGRQEQAFWAEIAHMLPQMPHSEVRRRVAELFPSAV